MKYLAVAFAIACGMVVLLGYFFPELASIQVWILNVAIVLAGWATLVGIINLLSVHVKRLQRGSASAAHSLIILIAFAATFVFGLLYGPSDPNFQKWVTAVQVPIEASLMGVLALSLIYACIRLLQKRPDPYSLIFLGSVLLFLVLNSGVVALGDTPVIKSIVTTLNRLPLAGARGLLLGVALGSLTAGLRILFGTDRPYGG